MSTETCSQAPVTYKVPRLLLFLLYSFHHMYHRFSDIGIKRVVLLRQCWYFCTLGQEDWPHVTRIAYNQQICICERKQVISLREHHNPHQQVEAFHCVVSPLPHNIQAVEKAAVTYCNKLWFREVLISCVQSPANFFWGICTPSSFGTLSLYLTGDYIPLCFTCHNRNKYMIQCPDPTRTTKCSCNKQTTT